MAGSRENGPRGPIYTRRWVLGASGAFLLAGAAAGAGIELTNRGSGGTRPATHGSPSAPDTASASAPQEHLNGGVPMLTVEHAQLRQGKKVRGFVGTNIYSFAGSGDLCGSALRDDQRELAFATLKKQGFDTLRFWVFQHEDALANFQKILGYAEKYNMYLYPCLADNGYKGIAACGDVPKDNQWYASGFQTEGLLQHAVDVTKIAKGNGRVIAIQSVNEIDGDPTTVNGFLKAFSEAVKDEDPDRLVSASFQSGKPLVAPNILPITLGGGVVNMADLHLYPPFDGTPQGLISAYGNSLPDQIQAAQEMGLPTFIGELGIPAASQKADIAQYRVLLQNLTTHPNVAPFVAGILSWGEQIPGAYSHYDKFQFSPGSMQLALMQQFEGALKHPMPIK